LPDHESLGRPVASISVEAKWILVSWLEV